MGKSRSFATWSALGMAVLVVGAGGSAAPWVVPVSSPTADPAPAATVRGVVKFQGTAPTMPAIDMSAESVCNDHYASPPTEQRVVVNGNGTLKNVFVYVKAGLDASARPAASADSAWIDQENCMYTPRVVGAMVGQRIAIRNSDPVLHNVNAKPTENRGFNISQPAQGMVSARNFRLPEVMVPIQCDVHGWMHAYVGVLSHPYFATTGDDGSFAIAGLPAGTYTIEAWHEEFGVKTVEVTVGADETKTVEFTFAGS